MAKTVEEINHMFYLNIFYSSTAFARDMVRETIDKATHDLSAHELLQILEEKAAEAWKAVEEANESESKSRSKSKTK